MGLSERVARSAENPTQRLSQSQSSFQRKMTAGKQAQTPTGQSPSHAYHTLASGFKELKLIVSDNRDKSTMKLPA